MVRHPERQKREPGAANLDEIAWHLYGLPPRQFTAARDNQAKQARDAGDRALAEAIHGLGKPTMEAWLVNQLARTRPRDIHTLADLGAALRDATVSLDSDQVRQLSTRRQQVVSALVAQARHLGQAAGHPASRDTTRAVEETLHATLADPHAAAQVHTGRLTDTLSHTGFPGVMPAAAPSHGRPTTTTSRDERLAAARQDVATARHAHQESSTERDQAQESARQAHARYDTLTDQVENLTRQVQQAEAEQAEARRWLRTTRSNAARAERKVRQAEQRLATATAREQRIGTTRQSSTRQRRPRTA